ncbi:MAG: DNA polymerase III subunit gamma/tau [Dehalococcoidia bacterium]|nr:DNA polymerase III subunit gamma/tau [Dehalococcoidia bacterium]
MSNQVLYRKWRPQHLKDVAGQQHVTRTLGNALSAGKVAHAYLFCGPRGTGKTSTARILARAMNCLDFKDGAACDVCEICVAFINGQAMDLVEIDAASNRGIEDIRELREKINYSPSRCKYRVYIVDEVHMLTEPAFNALLKTLEEPPAHAVFILATTEAHKVPATIGSRCQRYDFRRIPRADLVARLRDVCMEESMDPENGVLDLVAATSGGSLRDALNVLEQMTVSYGSNISRADAQSFMNLSGDPRSLDMIRYLLKKDMKGGLSTIIQVTEDGIESRHFGRDVSELLRALLLIKTGAGKAVDLDAEIVSALQTMAAEVEVDDLSLAVRLFSKLDFRQEHPPSLPLELAFLEFCAKTTPAQNVGPSIDRAAGGVVTPTARRSESPPAAAAPRPTPRTGDAAREPQQARPKQEIAPVVGGESYIMTEEQIAAKIKEVSIPANKFIEALMRTGCGVYSIQEDTIVLSFKHPSHKERIEQPNNLKLAETALKSLLGKNYRIQCVVDPESATNNSRQGGHLLRAAVEMGGKVREDKQEDIK